MGKKILVIEDDPIATRLIEYVLKQRGYLVLTAPNGLEGLQIAQKEEPDLIVLNVMLPGIDGFEVCHRLRAEPQTAQSLILMFSGRAQQIDIANGLNMGADDYLTKPAAPSEIVSRVESLLTRKAGANSKIIAFLGPKGKVGTTTTVVNAAIALSQMGKRVIAVDLCPYDGSISERLGIKPHGAISHLSETPVDTIDHRALEPALVVHQTGVGVLRIRQPSRELETVALNNIDLLLDKFKETTDYFLLDLPFQPTVTTRAVLSKCTLAIIVSNYTIDDLTAVRSTITVLRFLGILPQRIGAVVTDPEGTFPEGDLPQIKSYVEHTIAVNVLGIIPYDINASHTPSSGKTLVILTSPGSPMAGSIKELAQRIIAEDLIKNDAPQTGVKRA
jgi:CheY-like chemotaxis protein/MinD-like ATPase involved in chromosome partitioning or flagellar assembly